jgi:CheY-like chemotaxis protein
MGEANILVEADKLRVLVVEDYDAIRRNVARLLSIRGCDVETAASCSEALERLGPFGVGIFDCSLSDGDGVELAAALIRLGRVARATFYTGGSDPARIARAVKVGAVVIKGDGMETLLRAVVQRPDPG